MKIISYLPIALLVLSIMWAVPQSLSGQCHPDRHNLTLSDSWISCTASVNPNSERGESHWIMYDLGQNYDFGSTHFWNLNLYDQQDDALRNIVVDVSFNGSTWTEAAQFELPKATISGFYQGDAGPDLRGFSGRYLLITAIDNYGGNCYGLSEIKVATTPMSVGLTQVDLGAVLLAQPNPFSDQTTIQVSLDQDGIYTWRIANTQGKIIMEDKVQVSSNMTNLPIDGGQLLPGLYLFTITDGERLSSLSIVKQ